MQLAPQRQQKTSVKQRSQHKMHHTAQHDKYFELKHKSNDGSLPKTNSDVIYCAIKFSEFVSIFDCSRTRNEGEVPGEYRKIASRLQKKIVNQVSFVTFH
jgi:hypothetical protein